MTLLINKFLIFLENISYYEETIRNFYARYNFIFTINDIKKINFIRTSNAKN
ncbi:MAG: hypothetical protein BWY38_02190 [Ignavibacteria bacterium ADurb.Bin266]|jgi:hypothetical protein|nr:MAG: hypothetical protein BWY38_02190 [Ignavibacteria bacterium ADurb.Bin266]